MDAATAALSGAVADVAGGSGVGTAVATALDAASGATRRHVRLEGDGTAGRLAAMLARSVMGDSPGSFRLIRPLVRSLKKLCLTGGAAFARAQAFHELATAIAPAQNLTDLSLGFKQGQAFSDSLVELGGCLELLPRLSYLTLSFGREATAERLVLTDATGRALVLQYCTQLRQFNGFLYSGADERAIAHVAPQLHRLNLMARKQHFDGVCAVLHRATQLREFSSHIGSFTADMVAPLAAAVRRAGSVDCMHMRMSLPNPPDDVMDAARTALSAA
eukprot:gene27988-48351_t